MSSGQTENLIRDILTAKNFPNSYEMSINCLEFVSWQGDVCSVTMPMGEKLMFLKRAGNRQTAGVPG
jgi:hypothetical protein